MSSTRPTDKPIGRREASICCSGCGSMILTGLRAAGPRLQTHRAADQSIGECTPVACHLRPNPRRSAFDPGGPRTSRSRSARCRSPSAPVSEPSTTSSAPSTTSATTPRAGRPARLEALEAFAADLASSGRPAGAASPVLRRLVPVSERSAAAGAASTALIEANRLDQRGRRTRPTTTCSATAALSADPVGRLVLACSARDAATGSRCPTASAPRCSCSSTGRTSPRTAATAGSTCPPEDLARFGVARRRPRRRARPRRAAARYRVRGRPGAARCSTRARRSSARCAAGPRLAVAGYVAGGRATARRDRAAADYDVLAAPPRPPTRDVPRGLRRAAARGRR